MERTETTSKPPFQTESNYGIWTGIARFKLATGSSL